jgi:hypothetical protein
VDSAPLGALDKSRRVQMRAKSILGVLILIVITFGSQCKKNTVIDDEMLGTWKTASHKYKDTYFELKKSEVWFGTVEGGVNSYIISEIDKKQKNEDWILYTIYYIDEALKKSEFVFYYCSSDDGLIRFKNQPTLVWKKEKLTLNR